MAAFNFKALALQDRSTIMTRLLVFLFLTLLWSSEGQAQAPDRWKCGSGAGCVCSNTDVQQEHDTMDYNNNMHGDGVSLRRTTATCHVKTWADFTSISTSLPPSLKSLSIICARKNVTISLTAHMFARYTGITEIVLEGCRLQSIHQNFASGAYNLTELRFRLSHLPLLTKDTLSSLQNLKLLSVTSSSMVNFPLFQQLHNLRVLDLSHNAVKSPILLIDDAKQNTPVDLVNVTLCYNGIQKIPPKFFTIIPNVKYLNLDGNSLKDLLAPPNTLQDLQTFTAVDNNLDSFDLKNFTSFRKLTQLRVAGSGRKALSLEENITVENLIDLKLSGFKLNDSFWSLLNTLAIRKLDVSSNSLENVHMSHLPYLQRIYLQENSIVELPPDTFKNQPNLLVVNASFNNISHLPENLFSRNPHLIGFLLKGNKVSKIGYDFFKATPNIFYVDISYNEITRLPFGIFSGTPDLLFLYIQGNQLSFLPHFSNLKRLHILDVSHNRLVSFSPNTFKGLDSLQFLFANDNRLVIIPAGLFDPCPSLLEANFHNNSIKHIGSLGRHPTILKLNFENNSLTDFTSISPFSHMQALQYAFLDDNKFQTIYPNMFPRTIQIISMSHNDIRYVLVKSLRNMPNLSFVNFMRNRKVLSMPQSSVQKLAQEYSNPDIYLDFTTLSCSCWLGYLKVWDERRHDIAHLEENFPNFKGLENAVCSIPRYPDASVRFKDLHLKDFVCEYSEPVCYASACDCCTSSNNDTCQCEYTCPTECQCFEGGSSFWKHYVHIVCSERKLATVPNRIPALATFVYLDGNSLGDLYKVEVLHLTHVEELYLNNSGISAIEDGVFDNMSKIEKILLNENLLISVGSSTFGNISSLVLLDLSYNQISWIEIGSFDDLVNLHTLYLNNNRLKYFIGNVLELPNLHSVTLASNDWSCDCDVIENLSSYVLNRGNMAIIKDRSDICCRFDNAYIQETFFNSFRNISTLPLLTASLSSESYNDSLPPRSATSPDNNLPKNHSSKDDSDYHYSSTKDAPGSIEFHKSRATHFDDQTFHDLSNVSCFPLASLDFGEACAAIADSDVSVTNNRAVLDDDVELSHVLIVSLSITATILVLLIPLILLFTWRRNEIQALMYAKTGVRILDKKVGLDKRDKWSKPFDVFVSYSQKDHDFVCTTLVPGLEANEYRVCVHYRDFPVGGEISDVINRAIRLSSRTVLIVSKHFLKSNWCRYEFQTAHHHVLKEGSHRLILVLMEDIPTVTMDPDFRTHMKINTYLKVQDTLFWEKLHFSLPDISNRKRDEERDETDTMMRGMRILSRVKDYPIDDENVDNDKNNDNKVVDDEEGSVKNEGGGEEGGGKHNKMQGGGGGGEEEEEGGGGGGGRKIDWKKEEEKIINERRCEEKLLTIGRGNGVFIIEDVDIELELVGNVNSMYADRGFDVVT